MSTETHPASLTPQGIERKLVAILSADAQGYSRPYINDLRKAGLK